MQAGLLMTHKSNQSTLTSVICMQNRVTAALRYSVMLCPGNCSSISFGLCRWDCNRKQRQSFMHLLISRLQRY